MLFTAFEVLLRSHWTWGSCQQAYGRKPVSLQSNPADSEIHCSLPGWSFAMAEKCHHGLEEQYLHFQWQLLLHWTRALSIAVYYLLVCVTTYVRSDLVSLGSTLVHMSMKDMISSYHTFLLWFFLFIITHSNDGSSKDANKRYRKICPQKVQKMEIIQYTADFRPLTWEKPLTLFLWILLFQFNK